MDRQKKIQFLKDVASGKSQPQKPLSESSVWFVNADGSRTNLKTGQVLDKEQSEAYFHGKNVITFK